MTIEESISYISGNKKYQNTLLKILCFGQLALSMFVMSFPYMLPYIELSCDNDICTVPSKYQNTATVALGLVSENEYKIGLVGSSYFLGIISSSILINWISDKYGRKPVIKYLCAFSVPFLIIAGTTSSFSLFIISTFALGISEFGIYSNSFILFSEIVENHIRNWYAGWFSISWSLGAIIATIFYMIEINWRYIVLLSAIMLCIQFFLIGYVFESPRFLLTNLGKADEAIIILNKISEINSSGVTIGELKQENANKRITSNFFTFCKSKTIIFNITICSIIWFNIILGYYGMIFIMPSLFSNVYIEGIVMGVAETLANITTAYFVNVVGRKRCAIISFSISGISFIAIFMLQKLNNSSIDSLVLISSGVARFAISAQFFMIYIYTAELFPTYVRSMAFGVCNLIGRLAGICSSNLFEICKYLSLNPSFLLGSLLCFSGFLSMFLQETLGRTLEEVIPEDLEKEIKDSKY